MIFVDTSVWIDYFNGNDTAATDRLDTALQDEAVVIGDLVLLEILQGFRREADYQQAKLLLQHLAIYDLLGQDTVEEYARYFRILRKRGITIRKTADVIEGVSAQIRYYDRYAHMDGHHRYESRRPEVILSVLKTLIALLLGNMWV